jgi:hypothetical protein
MSDPISQPTKWLLVDDDPPPQEPGWYPALVCWTPEEGYFPNGEEWTGQTWEHPRVSHYLPVKCKDEGSARDIAYEHDPSW